MDFVEVEGKTYEEAIRKAVAELQVEEKDLDIEVKEVDTKGILGLLGSKKVKIIARLRQAETAQIQTPEPAQTVESSAEQEEYGKQFLIQLARIYGVNLKVKIGHLKDRILFSIEADDEDAILGKDGEVLEAFQYLARLAIAKKYKVNLKLLLDANGFRERRKKTIIVMAKRLADKVKKGGTPIKTKPLNPYERRIVHTLFKNSRDVTTSSEGDGHTKKVIISPSGPMNARR